MLTRVLLNAAELIECSRKPRVNAPARRVRQQLHRVAHAERCRCRQLGRHAWQVRRLRRHVDWRVREAEQIAREHVRQLQLHQIEQLSGRRANALGPPFEEGIIGSRAQLELVAEQHLMSGISVERLAHRPRVVRDRPHSNHACNRCGANPEDRAELLALVH